MPGTYSILASSVEEEVARNYICFGGADLTCVVADATCLERNLNLVLQILEITGNVVLCVNLIDEAKKKKIQIDIGRLSKTLGIPSSGRVRGPGRASTHYVKRFRTPAIRRVGPVMRLTMVLLWRLLWR